MNLQGLIVCRNLLKEEVFGGISDRFEIAARLVEKAEQLGLSGNLYRAYLIYLLAHEPNLVSETVEANGGKIGESLRAAFQHDIKILQEIFNGTNSNFEILENYSPTVKNKVATLAEIDFKASNFAVKAG